MTQRASVGHLFPIAGGYKAGQPAKPGPRRAQGGFRAVPRGRSDFVAQSAVQLGAITAPISVAR
jgi:hypothetical protein